MDRFEEARRAWGNLQKTLTLSGHFDAWEEELCLITEALQRPQAPDSAKRILEDAAEMLSAPTIAQGTISQALRNARATLTQCQKRLGPHINIPIGAQLEEIEDALESIVIAQAKIAQGERAEALEMLKAIKQALPIEGERGRALRKAFGVVESFLTQPLDIDALKGWMPIESAPRDGTRVIAYFAHTMPDMKVSVVKFVGLAWDWEGDDGAAWTIPDAWMPLPAAPDVKDKP